MAEEQADTGVGTTQLGLERYVQFAFIGSGVTAIWLLDHLITVVWNLFAEPDPTISIAAAAIAGIALTVGLYLNQQVKSWAYAVGQELSKVTWPTRKETWSATIVVVITSLIAAVILFSMDLAWSSVTDLIYKVKV